MTASVKSRTKESQAALLTLARALLGSAVGFGGCAEATLDALVAQSRLRHYARGEYVAHRGEQPAGVGMLVDGVLESSITRTDGRRHLVGFMQPGYMFGLIAMLDGQGHVNDLCPRSPASVLWIPSSVLRRFRAADPGLVEACERQLVLRSRYLYDRLAADPGVPLEARVAGMLQTLAALYGHPRDGGVVLDMKVSQADLADWLGMSRQRVNFVLKQLEAAGVIDLRYSALTILDTQKLADRART